MAVLNSNVGSGVPLSAWFTVHGDFIGVSGIPVRLSAGQQIDPNAWYTVDGHRAPVAGPFRNEAMNRQGYLRGAQIIAAEKLQRAANKTSGRGLPPSQPAPSLGPIDFVGMGVGAAGTVVQLGEWSCVKEGADGIERWKSPKNGRWYPTASRPNGTTGPKLPTLRAAKRFQLAGKVLSIAGLTISGYQGISAYLSEDKDRERKMAKAGLDTAIGLVGLFGGPIGFAVSTVYFVVDTSIALLSNGQYSILDLFVPTTQIPYGPAPRHTLRSNLIAPADNTRVYASPRAAPRTLQSILNQKAMADHNAVFSPMSHPW